MGGWWVERYLENGAYVELLSWVFWVLASITLHELAHGWAALAQGDNTPRLYNRMTANPVVHMGIPSLIIFALIGLAWGMMPVNPGNFRNRKWGRLIVAIAGPAMNLGLALLCLVVLVLQLKFMPMGSSFYHNFGMFLHMGLWLNLVLACLNMLPVPPLDGSTVLGAFSFRIRMMYANPRASFFGFIGLVVIFVIPLGGNPPLGSHAISGLSTVAIWMVDTLGDLIGARPWHSIRI
jgi:Zn-dependent protease